MLIRTVERGFLLAAVVCAIWILIFLIGLYRPMHYAVRHNMPGLAKFLASHGYLEEKELLFDGGYSTPLEIAANLNEREIVDFLLDSGAEIHFPEGRYPDVLQASVRHPELLAHLIVDRGIDPVEMIKDRDPDVARAANGDPAALALIKARGENGDGFMLVVVGEMYRRGTGVAKDESAAHLWFAEYAGMEESTRLYNAMHEKDPFALGKLTTKAENGDRYAQYFLGEIYEYGCETCDPAIERDFERSLKWYLKAADQGSRKAQEQAASFYRGAKTINKANGQQSFIIGHMPMPADYIQCYKWYGILASKAADLDDDERVNLYSHERDNCGNRLNDDEKREAMRLAADWKPVPVTSDAPPND